MSAPKNITEKTQLVNVSSPKSITGFSKDLKDFIVTNKLYTLIQDKNFVHVEGWQFAGAAMGYMFIPVSVENISPESGEVTYKTSSGYEVKNSIFKYKATVELVRVSDGQVVGRGYAICSNQEYKKKNFDEYSVLSMAQTRAIGKAGRNSLGWVMKLAGYEPTPAEEMEDTVVVDESQEESLTISEPSDDYKMDVRSALDNLPANERIRTLKNTTGQINLAHGLTPMQWFDLGRALGVEIQEEVS